MSELTDAKDALIKELRTIILLLVFIMIFLVHINQSDGRRDITMAEGMNSLVEVLKRESMCRVTGEDFGLVDGYYDGAGFYCVWVEGRSEYDINQTELHEIAHHFVKQDPEHFCSPYYNITLSNDKGGQG